MNQPQQAHLDHMAPVRHLVRHVLHPGKGLEDHVKRLRWRRKRPLAAPAPATAAPEGGQP